MKNESEQHPPDDVSPEVRRKAQRTIWILYIVMGILVLLPFVMLFFR